MKRLHKATLLILRNRAHRWDLQRLYYWADDRLYMLRSVNVMPRFYYKWLYQASMWLVKVNKFQRMADWTIHMVPLQIRFDEADGIRNYGHGKH